MFRIVYHVSSAWWLIYSLDIAVGSLIKSSEFISPIMLLSMVNTIAHKIA